MKTQINLQKKAQEVEATCGIKAEVEVDFQGISFLKLERKFTVTDGILVARVAGSKGKEYQIRKQCTGSWTCTCHSYRFSRGEIGAKFPCKHLRGLWEAWKRQQMVVGMMILAPQAL